MNRYQGDFAVGKARGNAVFLATVLPSEVTVDSLTRLRDAIDRSGLVEQVDSFGIIPEDGLVYIHAIMSQSRYSPQQTAVRFARLRSIVTNVGIRLDPRPGRLGGLPDTIDSELYQQLH